MNRDALEYIARMYWDLSPDEFDQYLRRMSEMGEVYEAVLSAYLAGLIDDEWASQFAEAIES